MKSFSTLFFLFTVATICLSQTFDTIQQNDNGLILRWEKIKKIDGKFYIVNCTRVEVKNGDFVEEKRGTFVQPSTIDSLILSSQNTAQIQIAETERAIFKEKLRLAINRREAEIIKKTKKELTDDERRRIEREENQKLKSKN